MVTEKIIGNINGTDVYEYEISDGRLRVTLMEYGATIHNVFFDGVDCVAGYDDLEGYINGDSYQGSTVGRYANRIANAKFTLDGKEYAVGANEKDVTMLHGGFVGFSHRLYKGEKVSDNAVKFTMESPDGEGGFPGNLVMSVTFSVENDTLKLFYEAESDKATVVNFTNHAYFHLGAPNNLTTVLTMDAKYITPVDDLLIPTGELMDVTGTYFDFTKGRVIGQDIEKIDIGGYDHNFVLGDKVEYKKNCISAYCPETGITMNCSTDMPAVQFYASCVLDEPVGKGGKPLTKYRAYCLETQFYPDTPNKPSFPSCRIEAGEKFTSVTEYEFVK